MPYPGGASLLEFTVDPNDATTGVTVVLNGPDGSTLTPTLTSSDGGHTWTGAPTWTVPGRWIAYWTITGMGAGTTESEVYVSQPMTAAAAVAWRPELWHVADYIPARTLVGAVDGYGNALSTFTADTHPTDQAVNRLITAACSWVTSKTGPVDASLDDLAQSVAAKYAASQVELTYPDTPGDLNTAQLLYQQAVAARDDLWKANEAITGEDPEDPEAHLMPVYSFPPAYLPGSWAGLGWNDGYGDEIPWDPC